MCVCKFPAFSVPPIAKNSHDREQYIAYLHCSCLTEPHTHPRPKSARSGPAAAAVLCCAAASLCHLSLYLRSQNPEKHFLCAVVNVVAAASDDDAQRAEAVVVAADPVVLVTVKVVAVAADADA